MKLEVLHVPDCPNLSPMLERLAQVTDLPVATRVIDSDAEAAKFGMAGSPTLLIDGVDPFTSPDRCEWGVSCRLYRDENGRIVSAPSVEQLRDAISAARQAQPPTPGEVLSVWRTRALPLDPVRRRVRTVGSDQPSRRDSERRLGGRRSGTVRRRIGAGYCRLAP